MPFPLAVPAEVYAQAVRRNFIDDLVRAGAPKRELAALRSAIELQLGYEIFMAADVTKIELSTLMSTM